MRGALHDLAAGSAPLRREGERIGERLDQADLGDHRLTVGADDRRAVRVELEQRYVLVQHRVAEAVDRVGELRRDRRIEMDVGVAEQVDGRRDLACELLEHEVLVLGLGAELGGLEQPLAVPLVVLDAVRQVRARQHPVGGERGIAVGELAPDQLLDLLDQAVVLVVEDVVHRGQRDVLVDAPVAGDVVRVEQLVVVGAGARARLPTTVSASARQQGAGLLVERLGDVTPCR